MSSCYTHAVDDGIYSEQPRWLAWIVNTTASLLVAILPATGHADEALFSSNFDLGVINQRPSHNQLVGTATIWGPPHTVLIGLDEELTNKALIISRFNEPDEVGFRGQFAHTRGYGNYTVQLLLHFQRFISSSFKFTLDLEPRHQQTHPPERFLRLDILPDGRLRFDENNATRFGNLAPRRFKWI